MIEALATRSSSIIIISETLDSHFSALTDLVDGSSERPRRPSTGSNLSLLEDRLKVVETSGHLS